MSNTLKFDKEYDTGKVIGKPLGRIYLGDGIIRLVLMPDGVHALATNTKFLHLLEPVDGPGMFIPSDENQ